MLRHNICFFFGAGASAFMGLPATEPLMKSFINKHLTCDIDPMLKNYEKENIEDLYSDVNELLESKNIILQHIPMMCANKTVKENDDIYSSQLQCSEHRSLQNESNFKSIRNTLEQLKHSLGKHVFESLNYKVIILCKKELNYMFILLKSIFSSS